MTSTPEKHQLITMAIRRVHPRVGPAPRANRKCWPRGPRFRPKCLEPTAPTIRNEAMPGMPLDLLYV